MSDSELAPLLRRVAEALERLAPAGADDAALDSAQGFVWHADGARLEAVPRINRLEISLLKGIDRVRDILLDNTRRFARGLPANNALLWGARGMGKSSLIKAVHGVVATDAPGGLKLIEIHREEIGSLPLLLGRLRGCDRQCLLFCDDLSFEAEDTTYKSLKAALEGGISGRPDNVLFYATSNRRHMMSRDMIDNERSTAIHPGEAVGGVGLALRPLRSLARLPSLRSGDLLRHGRGLRRSFRSRHRPRGAARRGDRVEHDARRPLGPGGLAVRSGPGRATRGRAQPSRRPHRLRPWACGSTCG